jgi:hypothetical protein
MTHGGSLSHEVTSRLGVSWRVLFSHWIRAIVCFDVAWRLRLVSWVEESNPTSLGCLCVSWVLLRATQPTNLNLRLRDRK